MFELRQGRERGGDVLGGRIFYVFSGGFFGEHLALVWGFFCSCGIGWFGRAGAAEERRTNASQVSVRWWPPDGFSRASLPAFRGGIAGVGLTPPDAAPILPLAGAASAGSVCGFVTS